MQNQRAVITADIVNSTPSWVAELRRRIEQIIYASQAKTEIYFYRGDRFQCYLADPYSVYRLALQLRTEARLFEKDRPNIETDLRISIGIGSVEMPVTQLATAQGAAFVLSGRGLDELEESERRLRIQCSDVKTNIALKSISLFTDYLFKSLTMKQAEVLQHLLNNRTQLETAKLLNKSQSTINRHVQSMGWKQIEELINLYGESLTLISETNE